MFEDDKEPKDWEIEEEVPSKQLERKWTQEDWEGQPPVICSVCKKEVRGDSLTCIFCGAEVYQGKSGFLIKFLAWIKKIFK